MQLDLLSTTPTARGTDPESSHQAAEHITKIGDRATQQRQVVRAAAKWPGLTSRELAAKMNQCRYVVARRLPEVSPIYVTNGPPRRCTVTGRLAQTWWPQPIAKKGDV